MMKIKSTIENYVNPSLIRWSRVDSKILRYFLKIIFGIKMVLSHPVILDDNAIKFNILEMVVTTNCSLRCKDCSNLMQHYSPEKFRDPEILTSDLKKLLDSIDYAARFNLIGGEPLLYPYLGDLLEVLLQSPKVGIVTIVTNGTVMPRKEILPYLRNKKTAIYVSDYGVLSTKKDALVKLEHVFCKINKADEYWCDYGAVKKHGRTVEQLKKQYKRCNLICYSYFNGCLHRCPRSGHGMDLQMIPVKKDEYVNIRMGKDTGIVRNEIKKLMEKECITACDYCNRGTEEYTPIPAAIQLGKGERRIK